MMCFSSFLPVSRTNFFEVIQCCHVLVWKLPVFFPKNGHDSIYQIHGLGFFPQKICHHLIFLVRLFKMSVINWNFLRPLFLMNFWSEESHPFFLDFGGSCTGKCCPFSLQGWGGVQLNTSNFLCVTNRGKCSSFYEFWGVQFDCWSVLLHFDTNGGNAALFLRRVFGGSSSTLQMSVANWGKCCFYNMFGGFSWIVQSFRNKSVPANKQVLQNNSLIINFRKFEGNFGDPKVLGKEALKNICLKFVIFANV